MHNIKECKCGGKFKLIGTCESEQIYVCDKCGKQLYVPIVKKRFLKRKGRRFIDEITSKI